VSRNAIPRLSYHSLPSTRKQRAHYDHVLRKLSAGHRIDCKENSSYLWAAINEQFRILLDQGKHLPLVEFLERVLSVYPDDSPDIPEIKTSLCETFGFIGDYESAWGCCKRFKTDWSFSNYRSFAVHCGQPSRSLSAGESGGAWTSVGRQYDAEIRKHIDEWLADYETKNGCNLYDAYIKVSDEVVSKALGNRVHPTDGHTTAFQERVTSRLQQTFNRNFLLALAPYDDWLAEPFTNRSEYEQSKVKFLEESHIYLRYRLHRHMFLYAHAYALKGGNTPTVYAGDRHQSVYLNMPVFIESAITERFCWLSRHFENSVRTTIGLPKIGEGWVSETNLYKTLEREFPNERIVRHARPAWLGRQHLDVYFPRLNIAVEYQGTQHQKPVTLFGGELGFKLGKQRDSKKRKLCELHNCELLEVFPEQPITPVVELIRSAIAKLPSAGAIRIESHSTPSSVDRRENDRSARAETAATSPQERPKSDPAIKVGRTWKRNLGRHDLAACARHGDYELIKSMANGGVKLGKFRNDKKETLLFLACYAGNVETARALVELGLDVNGRDYRLATILSKLCNGRIRPDALIVEFLMKSRADATLHGGRMGNTMIFDRCGYALPLNGCAIEGFLECAKSIHAHGGDINMPQPISRITPIMCACHPKDRHQFECRSFDMINWLVDNGADLRAADQYGLNAMDYALGATHSFYPQIGPCETASPEILKLLRDAGALPTKRFKLKWNNLIRSGLLD
jgi:ankyrin repeat protein